MLCLTLKSATSVQDFGKISFVRVSVEIRTGFDLELNRYMSDRMRQRSE